MENLIKHIQSMQGFKKFLSRNNNEVIAMFSTRYIVSNSDDMYKFVLLPDKIQVYAHGHSTQIYINGFGFMNNDNGTWFLSNVWGLDYKTILNKVS